MLLYALKIDKVCFVGMFSTTEMIEMEAKINTLHILECSNFELPVQLPSLPALYHLPSDAAQVI